MSRIIDAEKDSKAAYIVGCMDGEERAIDLVLTIIDNLKTYSMGDSLGSIYVDKDDLRAVVEALKEVNRNERHA